MELTEVRENKEIGKACDTSPGGFWQIYLKQSEFIKGIMCQWQKLLFALCYWRKIPLRCRGESKVGPFGELLIPLGDLKEQR